ncbi:MAG: A/G-specific adenine glycosylase [Chitinophagales bacterium]
MPRQTDHTIAKTMLKWNNTANLREMPWRGERNPYLIWLSEIILQQTRVEQGRPYFERFREHFPTVKCLAEATEDEVLRLWQGLGYYSRARNLHYTAKHINDSFNGTFPDSYKELLKLKGVGAYTAAAIASFAYNEPVAVVDGNVIRVLSRILGIETPFDSTAGKKEFQALAQQMLHQKDPAKYNQAIMDFGATVCLPKNPMCNLCPFSGNCFANLHDLQQQLPVRSKKTKVRERYFYYLLDRNEKGVLVRKRETKDIWQGLYEFPLVEMENAVKNNATSALVPLFKTTGKLKILRAYKQKLSHQTIHFVFAEGRTQSEQGFERVAFQNLLNYGFPKTLSLFMGEMGLI